MKAVTYILFIAITFLGQKSIAQEWENPVIKDYGRVKYYKDAEIQPDKKLDYKIIFDIKDAKEKDGVNKTLWHMARQLNLLGVAKIPKKNIHLVAVIHGPATSLVLSDAVYLKKYNKHNPNLDILKSLTEQGVKIYVCGQAAGENNIDPYTEMNPFINLSLSALITIPNYVLKGYVLMP